MLGIYSFFILVSSLPLVRGECLLEVSMCCDHKAPTCCNLPISFNLPFRKKGGKSSQCTTGHIQQRSFPT